MDTEKIWFVVIDNKAVGPHSVDEIKIMLQQGKVSYSDFIYKPGLAQWTSISEVADFERRGDLKIDTPLVTPEMTAPTEFNGWLLSVKKEGESIQSGPYTKEQVLEKIEIGEVKYDDLAWSKALSTWQTLGSITEFDRRNNRGAVKASKTHEEVTASGSEVKESPVVSEPALKPSPALAPETTPVFQPMLAQPEPKPQSKPLSQDEPLVLMPVVARASSPASTTVSVPSEQAIVESEGVDEKSTSAEPPLPVPKHDPTSDEPSLKPRRFNTRRWAIASVGAVFGMAIAYAGLNVYKQTLGQNLKVIEVAKKSEREVVMPEPSIAPTPVAAASVPTPAPKPVVITPQLNIVALKANTPSRPNLAFETNLPAGTVIKVHITAGYGKILNYPRMELDKEVTVIQGQMPTLELEKEDLPYGDYKVTASGGDLESHLPLSIGVHDQALIAKLGKHRTDLAVQEKKERSLLKDGAKYLAQADVSLAKVYSKTAKAKKNERKKKWSTALASWKKDVYAKVPSSASLEKQNPKSLIYPDAVAKFIKAKSKLHEVSRLYSAKLSSSRNVASQTSSLDTARQDLKGLLQELETDLKGSKK